MLSAEPLMDARGYPNLFATGETADGEPLVDRQHPHDLFMELAARVDVDIAEGTTAFLYGGPVGEPALGPRGVHAPRLGQAESRSADHPPLVRFDAHHLRRGHRRRGGQGVADRSLGVPRRRSPTRTAGTSRSRGSTAGACARRSTPSPNWALQVSYGRLERARGAAPGRGRGAAPPRACTTTTARGLAATAAFSAKNRMPGRDADRLAGARPTGTSTERHTLFGRFENVENDELFPDHADPLHDQAFRVTKLQAGYAYTLPLGPFGLSLGGSVAAFVKPDALDAVYGDNPMGYTLFAKLTLGR